MNPCARYHEHKPVEMQLDCELSKLEVDFHCHVIFMCVRTLILWYNKNRGDVYSVMHKQKS